MTWLLVAIVLLVVVLAVWQTIQLQQIRRKVEAVPSDGNVFGALDRIETMGHRLDATTTDLEARVADLERRIPLAVNRTAIVSYDAFGNLSGQLSRSIALLNDVGDGIVITILVSREETLFFVTEVRDGHGTEILSPEESAALDHALSS